MELHAFYMKCIMKTTLPLSMAVFTSALHMSEFVNNIVAQGTAPQLCLQGTKWNWQKCPKTQNFRKTKMAVNSFD
jgi:hypothetical protein